MNKNVLAKLSIITQEINFSLNLFRVTPGGVARGNALERYHRMVFGEVSLSKDLGEEVRFVVAVSLQVARASLSSPPKSNKKS